MASMTRTIARMPCQQRQHRYTAPAVAQQCRFSRRARVVALAALNSAKPRLRLLSSISRLCEIKGLTSIYEVVAGRSAMLGVITALTVELLNPEGEALLGQLSETNLSIAGASLFLSTLTAVVLGAQSVDTQDPTLLEPVITSLTAAQRAGSSITATKATNVDEVVDEVVSSTFTQERIRELTNFEQEL